MKQKLLVLTITMLCLIVTSCKNSVSEDIAGTGDLTGDETTKVVTLNFNEEKISMSQGQEPMTRAGGDAKKYYGINVYEQTDKGKTKYAYGLFDSVSNMSVILEEWNKYSIECVEVCNDEDTVLSKGDRLYFPFFRDNEPGEITNKFVYSTKTNNDVMTDGFFSKTEKDTIKFPKVYTYYGSVENLNPAENDEVSIEMRRAVFGLRFKINPPKDGVATLRYLNDYYITIKAGDEPYDHQSIYSFHLIKNAAKDGYNGGIRPYITWTYSNGTFKEQYLPIKLYRNTITTVEINFSGASPEGITFKEENTSFDNNSTSFTVGQE